VPSYPGCPGNEDSEFSVFSCVSEDIHGGDSSMFQTPDALPFTQPSVQLWKETKCLCISMTGCIVCQHYVHSH